jgi:hypothetical protein
MSHFVDRIRERVRQQRALRDDGAGRSAMAAPCAEGRMGCQFRAGDRVFDLITGQEGEVLGGTRENVIVPAPER